MSTSSRPSARNSGDPYPGGGGGRRASPEVRTHGRHVPARGCTGGETDPGGGCQNPGVSGRSAGRDPSHTRCDPSLSAWAITRVATSRPRSRPAVPSGPGPADLRRLLVEAEGGLLGEEVGEHPRPGPRHRRPLRRVALRVVHALPVAGHHDGVEGGHRHQGVGPGRGRRVLGPGRHELHRLLDPLPAEGCAAVGERRRQPGRRGRHVDRAGRADDPRRPPGDVGGRRRRTFLLIRRPAAAAADHEQGGHDRHRHPGPPPTGHAAAANEAAA